MLRSIVICPDRELAARLESALTLTGEVSVQRILNEYPTAIELVRVVRAYAPAAIFVSFESLDGAYSVIEVMERERTQIPVIAVHRQLEPNILRESMRMGVREFIADPFEHSVLMESIAQIVVQIAHKPTSDADTNQIFSFIPSKPGVGTSTVALNVSAALARGARTRVVLADLDLNCGMMRFLLKLANERSITDAVEHSLYMDETLWPQMITSLGNLDVMHAGRANPNLRIDSAQIRGLIGYMRRTYAALCFDLSGNLEKFSVEIMRESKRILMVCNPEKSSLLLAKEKLEFLRMYDLEGRVSIVLNRCQKKPPYSVAEVEEVLGVSVAQVLPNDYLGVHRSIEAGSWMPAQSELGKKFTQFADVLMEREVAKTPVKKSFLEFFALTPVKQYS